LPTTSDAIVEAEPEFYVEEPEESGQLILHEDLSNFLKRIKSEPPFPIQPNNKALILYTPGGSILNRIVEITDADHPEDEPEEQPRVETRSSTPTTSPVRQNEMEEENEEGMEPMETD
jgi:hypothetical protein